ncbi:hypothetical protein [Butyricicoccus pullicaecorum]|uniref:Uncharacterized protein n=1 Tax=Butyricicoccus pullicaecorum TaxID=501571 RepID=A0A1Y4LJF5_9FIRM|nr:hypothetical protein [Butyricicoccus pullicaecorum]OUP55619.1 hypothetical protein B5F15_14575 [Butyricicoccus pullicaecorum]
MKQIQMQMTDYSVSSEWWKKLITHFIQTNDEIEIRCWKEEISEIAQASLYGTPVSDGWEVSIRTIVTRNLLQELQTENPTDKSIYNKMRGNPKFCVTAKTGANREKFIMGGRREKRLPPC